MRCGARCGLGGREGVGRRRRKRHARGKARLKASGPQGTRGAHSEHQVHGRDLGGVKAQRLVERRRGLPSRREGHAMRGEVRARRREGVRRRRRKRHARGGRPDSRREGQGTRGAHCEHAVHVRDAGGVKAQRLVERLRVLPSRREGHAMRGEVAGREAGGGEAAAAQAACSGEARFKAVGGQGTRGAHVEHAVNVRDLGGVKAQRLVEGRRFLPSRREGHMRCGVRCGLGGREGVERWHRKRHAQGRPVSRLGGQGTRGAHSEHGVHVRDLGGVEAQRLIEHRRALPSRREGHAMRGEVRARRREGVRRRRRKRHARGKARSTQGLWGPGHARSAPRTCGTCP